MSPFEKPGGHRQPPSMGPPPPPGSVGKGATLLPELGLYQALPWKRLVARLVDWIVIAIPAVVIWWQLIVVECRFGDNGVGCGVSGWRYVMVGLLTMIMTIGYFIGLTWFFGATPGKRLLGLAVVTHDGEVPNLEACALRGAVDGAATAVLLLPFATSRWIFIGIVAAVSITSAVQLLERTRQTDLYDLMAETYVVRR